MIGEKAAEMVAADNEIELAEFVGEKQAGASDPTRFEAAAGEGRDTRARARRERGEPPI